jgi:subtilase family serine protease
LSLPAGIAVGAYYVIAKADGDNVVAETQEANNTTARAITIGPDLIVATLSVPFTIAAGSTVQVSDLVQNAGGDTAGPSTTRFYLSANQILDSGDIPLSGSRMVAAVPGGSSSSGTTAVTIPATTVPGFYYVFAVADADGAVAEAVETNNTKVVLIWIVAASGN